MKTQLTALMFLLVVIVFSTVSRAQTIITSTDATAINAVGNLFTNHYDTTATSIDIGTTGAASWDFLASY